MTHLASPSTTYARAVLTFFNEIREVFQELSSVSDSDTIGRQDSIRSQSRLKSYSIVMMESVLNDLDYEE